MLVQLVPEASLNEGEPDMCRTLSSIVLQKGCTSSVSQSKVNAYSGWHPGLLMHTSKATAQACMHGRLHIDQSRHENPGCVSDSFKHHNRICTPRLLLACQFCVCSCESKCVTTDDLACRHEDMMAVYNQHLLLSGTPVLKFKEQRWQHTPMADTPHSHASSSYDLEDSFLVEGKQ